jgi:hypothetical protein
MSSQIAVSFKNGKYFGFATIFLLCLLLPLSSRAQKLAEKTPQPRTTEKDANPLSEAEALSAQRHAFAISLITSLADDARSYHDLALRPHVLARAADRLWDADSDTARNLFRRAWEAAEKGDADELTLKTPAGTPAMATALLRISGNDLRADVLALAARRDRALGEEFLGKLKEETKRDADDSKNDSSASDSWSDSEAASKRIHLAKKLLDAGEIDRALEFAAPVLSRVTANSIGFLSALRARRPDLADERFAFLLTRAEFDPSSDANTASGLSSYVFTPGLYVTFNADGGARWNQPDEGESIAPPVLPPALLNKFFQVAASILLRPSPAPDQDFTSAGRTGKYMVIKRLLPLFDQYAPDTATALRTQLSALVGDRSPKALGDDNNPLLRQGLVPEETAAEVSEKLQDRLDHAKTSRHRDQIYAEAAVAFANQGDPHAQDLADKIDDSARRTEVRRYVDFQLVQLAIKKKDAPRAARLAKAGQLTHTQRAWAYTQLAQLTKSQRPRSLEFLDEAVAEARRIEASDPDRASALIGVATQLVTLDRVRAWETIGEAVKAANSAEKFTGENLQFSLSMIPTRNGLKFGGITAEDFALAGVLHLLAKDDLYRSIDLAKDFKNDAPRATALLIIAGSVLEKAEKVEK